MTTIIRGRLTADPELRFTPSGAAVANFTIAEDIRGKNASGQWETTGTTFWRCAAWRDLAENVANSLHRGEAVLAFGQVKQRDYTTKEGEKRSAFEVDLDAIGPDLRWQTATVAKAERRTQSFTQPQAPASDPWGAPAATDEPPF